MIGNELEGSSHSLIEILSQHLPRETEENNEIPVRTSGVPARIRKEHLPNTRVKFGET
jgi:hypothetical protein